MEIQIILVSDYTVCSGGWYLLGSFLFLYLIFIVIALFFFLKRIPDFFSVATQQRDLPRFIIKTSGYS